MLFRSVLIEPDKAGVGGGAAVENGESVAGGVAIDPGDIIGGETLGIGLAGGKGESAGVGVFDQFGDEEVDVGEADSLGIRAPVVGIGFKDDSFGRLVRAKSEGAGGEKAVGFFLGQADVPGLQQRSIAKGGFEFVLGQEPDAADSF